MEEMKLQIAHFSGKKAQIDLIVGSSEMGEMASPLRH
jgi:hypothetical protein